VGPNGLLNRLTKNVLETALDAEMTEYLGYDKHDPAGRGSGNSRNGVRSNTVLTEIGPVDIDVPRDVNSSFDPIWASGEDAGAVGIEGNRPALRQVRRHVRYLLSDVVDWERKRFAEDKRHPALLTWRDVLSIRRIGRRACRYQQGLGGHTVAGRPPLRIGQYGKITRTPLGGAVWLARCRFRDADGVTRIVERRGPAEDQYGKLAEDALVEVVLQRRATAVDGVNLDTKIMALVDQHIDRLEEDGRAVRTIDTYRYCAKLLSKIMAGVRVGEATPSRLDAAIRSMGRAHGDVLAGQSSRAACTSRSWPTSWRPTRFATSLRTDRRHNRRAPRR
jgi:hypothetical protein